MPLDFKTDKVGEAHGGFWAKLSVWMGFASFCISAAGLGIVFGLRSVSGSSFEGPKRVEIRCSEGLDDGFSVGGSESEKRAKKQYNR